MAFMKNKKNNIIEFEGDNTVWFERVDVSEFSSNAIVIVPPTHNVYIVKDGAFSEALETGRHELFSIKKKFLIFSKKVKDSDRTYVVFISKTVKAQINWGTTPEQELIYIEPKLGMPIKLGAFGLFELKVLDPMKFYLEIVSAFGEEFTAEDLENRIRVKTLNVIIEQFKRFIKESNYSYYDLENEKTVVQEALLDRLKTIFNEQYGFEMCDFFIENVNILDEEDERRLKQEYERVENIKRYRANRSFELEKQEDAENDVRHNLKFRRSIMEDETALYNNERDRVREQQEYERKNRIEDEDRAFEREEKRAEREKSLKEKEYLYDAVKSVGWESRPTQVVVEKGAAGRFCVNCGASYGPNDMFCPSCGTATKNNDKSIICPHCGESVSVKMSFCPFCGNKIK